MPEGKDTRQRPPFQCSDEKTRTNQLGRMENKIGFCHVNTYFSHLFYISYARYLLDNVINKDGTQAENVFKDF